MVEAKKKKGFMKESDRKRIIKNMGILRRRWEKQQEKKYRKFEKRKRRK